MNAQVTYLFHNTITQHLIFTLAFLKNATIEYSSESLCASVFVCLCLCVCPCLCVCVCVRACVCLCFVCEFLHENSKRNRSRNIKYIVVYENSSDEFDIEHRRIKIKVTVGLQSSPFTKYRSYNYGTN